MPNYASICLNFPAHYITHCNIIEQNRYIEQVKTLDEDYMSRSGLNLWKCIASNDRLSQALEERESMATENLVMFTIVYTITVIVPVFIVSNTPASISYLSPQLDRLEVNPYSL